MSLFHTPLLGAITQLPVIAAKAKRTDLVAAGARSAGRSAVVKVGSPRARHTRVTPRGAWCDAGSHDRRLLLRGVAWV